MLGGEDALLHAYPWVAMLKWRKEWHYGRPGQPICGGAVINSRHGQHILSYSSLAVAKE